MTHNLLFIYGTLLDNTNAFAIYLYDNSTFYADGKFKGRLYDLGKYPAAFEDRGEPSYVYGKVFQLNEPALVLEKLDNYEGIGNRYPEPDEYVRSLVTIKTDRGDVPCWVYLYNLPEAGLRRINSGNYADR